MDKSSLRVGLVQTDIVWEDPAANYELMATQLAAAPASDVLILPEAFSTGFSMRGDGWESDKGRSCLTFLKEQAQALDCAVCGSTFYRPAAGARVVNRFFFVEPSGKTQHYDKRHRFAMAGEHEAYGPGNASPVVVEYLGWRLLLQVCYDLRFPVFSRNTPGHESYDVAIYVANWPDARRHHWRMLLTARAIENQSYVLGVNRVGVDATGLGYAGDSLAIDPNGHVIADLENKSSVALVVIDRSEVAQTRERLPFLLDADDFQLH